MNPLSPTERSTVRRGKKRTTSDRAALHAVLDAGLICHLGFVAEHGAPVVIPTGYGRDGDTLYVHGSTGAASLRATEDAEVCATVTLLDGIVYSRAVFHCSVNYRSAVVHGRGSAVTDRDAKLAALRVITEHLAPGTWGYARKPSRRELAATAVLALDLTEAAVKIRTGPPGEEPADLTRSTWAGVLPLHRSWGSPVPCPELRPGTEVPGHVAARPDPVAPGRG